MTPKGKVVSVKIGSDLKEMSKNWHYLKISSSKMQGNLQYPKLSQDFTKIEEIVQSVEKVEKNENFEKSEKIEINQKFKNIPDPKRVKGRERILASVEESTDETKNEKVPKVEKTADSEESQKVDHLTELVNHARSVIGEQKKLLH
jgi:valyl-tRNA synthetase